MKNNDTHDLRVSARTARLTAGVDDDEDGPPWRFGGVAVAAGDILHMDDGTRVLMTAEELRKAAESQAQEPLTADHPEDAQGQPQYPPPTDETVGKVAKAGWLDGAEGVGYEATTHDEEIADGVRGGTFDVSVHPRFTLGEFREDVQAYVAEDIQFLDLSVVSKGDSPSNTANWGPNQALASYTEETDIGAELTAADGVDDALDDGQQGLIANVVSATLRALGHQPAEDVLEDIPNNDEPAATTGAATDDESDTPTDDSDTTTMNDDKRTQYVSFLTANAGFDEESVDAMDDDVLEQTYELAAQASASGANGTGDGGSTDGGSDGDTELHAKLDEIQEEMVTEDDVQEIVADTREELSKADKVDEIIAQSDDYDEDDREDLLASAEPLLEQEHDRVTGNSGMNLPSGGASLTAGTPSESTDNEDDVDLDAYGTGEAN